MTLGIYQITNQVNRKCYIGSAVNIKRRWGDHLRRLRRGEHTNQHLQHAFNKYRESAFIFAVLESVANVSELISREQHYLDMLNPEYNIAITARSPMSGRRHTDEAKQKIREANTGRKVSLETRRKQSIAQQRRSPPSAETRTKLSIAMTGEANPNYGKQFSAEHRRKLSEAHMGNQYSKGVVPSAETRAKLSAAHRGKHHSEETKRKMSIAQKARWRRARMAI